MLPPAVLVVEDNDALLRLFVISLNRLGIDCDKAVNAEEALKHHLQKQYLLIFMDIDLPGMNGINAAIAIRKHELKHNLRPVVIIGISAGEVTKKECLAVGMNDFCQKPILQDTMITLLQTWVPALYY